VSVVAHVVKGAPIAANVRRDRASLRAAGRDCRRGAVFPPNAEPTTPWQRALAS
jgi:hypothetical protein